MFISFIIYFYIFPNSFITGCLIELMTYSIFDIARYGIYLETLVCTTRTIQEAKENFPYHGIISNFGNIIQFRSHSLYEKNQDEHYIIYVSGLTMLIGGIMCTGFWLDLRSNELFNDEFKTRRINIQSGIIFFGTVCKNLASLEVREYAYEDFYLYDAIPLGITFSLILASKYILRLKYQIYSIICPVVFLACIIPMLYFKNNIPLYILKAFYALFQTMHFTIFDPIRLILYIAHHNKLSRLYCAYDILWIGFAHLITIYLKMYINYTLVICNVIWIGLAYYSKKYYLKDYDRLECIDRLEAG